MTKARGYIQGGDGGKLCLSGYTVPKMSVPSALVPHCPHCGRPMTMNLRFDDKFVEGEDWHRAAERYEDFLRTREQQRVLFLELGVG